VGTVLFAALALGDPATARLFGALLEQGPGALASEALPDIGRHQAEIAAAFRAAFLTIAGFAAAGVALAWSIPARRL
jgi:hypothetical protein